MNCPIDGTELTMSDRQGIEIDYCPKCRGVWLDRGELDKIIQRSNEREADSGRPVKHGDYDHRRDHDRGYEGQRKRKSLISELFDF